MLRLLICFFCLITFPMTTLASGNPENGQKLTQICSACHGADGNSKIGLFPKLAGQQEAYLLKQLKDIQSGKRTVPQMANFLNAFSDSDLADIASYFAEQKIELSKADNINLKEAETLFRFGNKQEGIPACSACHGPAGLGVDSARFPALRGQFAQYTQTQLQNFKTGQRDNDPSRVMQDIAKKLSDQEAKALANYLQGLRENK